jgi:4-hydroxymandelate oxidase
VGSSGRWLDQVEDLARRSLSAPVFRYIAEGAREEQTLADNLAAWRAVRFAPRVLTDVTDVDVTTTLLGRGHAAPLGIAPMTLQRAAHPDGELAMAAAARDAGVPIVVSSNAGSTWAELGATGATWWLQVYLAPDRSAAEPLLRAAVDGGASAVVLTADTPVIGTRYPGQDGSVWDVVDPTWVGANATPTARFRPEDRDKALDLGPADVAWLAQVTGLPTVVKGLLRADDAVRCVDAGAAAVWVSNHGGRQLDQALSTAACLAGVRAAVGTTAEVYVDGGIRSGLHVLAALALGADAAFVGRPMFHALAAGGPDGAFRALSELRTELVESMRLGGVSQLRDTPSILAPTRSRPP